MGKITDTKSSNCTSGYINVKGDGTTNMRGVDVEKSAAKLLSINSFGGSGSVKNNAKIDLKKKEKEVQSSLKHVSQQSLQYGENADGSSCSSQPFYNGVVRNPINQFQPSSSASLSGGGPGSRSHVESIGDSGILMGNSRHEKVMERTKAEKLWSLAKNQLGFSTEEEEEEELFIERLRAMEERDKAVKGKKGKVKGTK